MTNDRRTRLVVASRNPVKLRAAETGFLRIFPRQTVEADGIAVDSGVGDQPSSDQETLLGATRRAEQAHRLAPEADFCFGIEGGIEDDGETMRAFAWIVVIDGAGRRGSSRSAAFTLPAGVATRVRAGHELGEADDLVFGESGSKRRGGAVGILTGGAIDRTALYAHAVALALVRFRRDDLDW